MNSEHLSHYSRWLKGGGGCSHMLYGTDTSHEYIQNTFEWAENENYKTKLISVVKYVHGYRIQ